MNEKLSYKKILKTESVPSRKNLSIREINQIMGERKNHWVLISSFTAIVNNVISGF